MSSPSQYDKLGAEANQARYRLDTVLYRQRYGDIAMWFAGWVHLFARKYFGCPTSDSQIPNLDTKHTIFKVVHPSLVHIQLKQSVVLTHCCVIDKVW